MKHRLRRGHPQGVTEEHLEADLDFPWHLGYGHGFMGWSIRGRFTPEQYRELHRLDHINDALGYCPSFRTLERAVSDPSDSVRQVHPYNDRRESA